ncbi:hypothetical protein [Ferruginibacter sp. SUN106]|uniref:hypothetical protein n=1 Tax=Ferruginibacter sp. SUN106 TaxID=2978348 RepID=UPI003D36A8AC
MRLILVAILFCCLSCNQNAKENNAAPAVAAAPTIIPVMEDSLTLKLRSAVTAIETKELIQTSTIKSIALDSITHKMISLKDYYTTQKEILTKSMKYSTDKDKTARALAYLDKMAAQSSSKPDVYKVQFHLAALLANSTRYNELHTKYLKEDLSEIKLVFP